MYTYYIYIFKETNAYHITIYGPYLIYRLLGNAPVTVCSSIVMGTSLILSSKCLYLDFMAPKWYIASSSAIGLGLDAFVPKC